MRKKREGYHATFVWLPEAAWQALQADADAAPWQGAGQEGRPAEGAPTDSMNARESVKLLFGPYKAPALRKGDHANCLYRDCDVRILGWTDAHIRWPLCHAIGARGGWGLLVDEELARAVRQESAAAIMYWWGVANSTVTLWRRALGVDRVNNPGSRRLILASAEKGAGKLRGVPLSAEQCERRRRTAVEHNLALYFGPGYYGPPWTAEQLALLGTAPDEEIAERIGRTAHAVSAKRRKLGIPNRFDGRRRECRG
jgi:hypothetical protein